ncbi:MAG: hypothetical protein QOF47_3256 [Mycobacterium sp.]|nr:hypothetical protein [Mycobacterium sp.]MDT5332202.1 hypothetical protein [Mycobacterium sp.]
MAKDHGPSVKDDKQYEGLRKKGHEQVAGRGDRQLARRGESGRQELGQQPKPSQQRLRQRRESVSEEGRRPQGRQEVELEP